METNTDNQEMLLTPEKEREMILKAYRSLLRSVKKDLSIADKRLIRKAFEMSVEAHKNMRRKSGEPYILHPIAVAEIVAKEIGLGATAISCALLHDVVEDTEITIDDIKREFGNKAANIVEGLTKFNGIFDINSSMQAENFRKLLLTLADDVRVVLIKLADRLHNMRTIDSLPERKQLKIASETSYIYAPLAHRLGLYNIKSEFEDICMKVTDRDNYLKIKLLLAQTKRERDRYINEFIKPLKNEIQKFGIQFKIYGRPKSISSIWNKISKKNVIFEEVYDLFAIRIVIDVPIEDEKQFCWRIYSLISDYYTPVPDRLKDWISTPKSNGYESLHTTVMGPKGRYVEVQIRSERMNEIAEKGFAAHWKYKEGSAESGLEKWLSQVREVLESSEGDALDFITDFKYNFFSEEIFVFTPKGDLRVLRNGATALDFAYDIHSDVGNKCIGAKVNHKLVPINQVLKNGDQVEIISSNKQKPADDWLNFAFTSKARSAIKKALNEQERQLADIGKEILYRKFKNLKIEPNEQNVDIIVSQFGFKSHLHFYCVVEAKKFNFDDLKIFEIEHGKLKLIPKEKSTNDTNENNVEKKEINNYKGSELVIFGEDARKIDYKLATCCNPIQGDSVFGYITASEGMKIHRTNCPNAANLMAKYGYRIVKVKWSNSDIAFLTGIKIMGVDEVGIINKLSSIISEKLQINMRSISVDSLDGKFEGTITLFVNDKNQLENLISELKKVKGINTVTRIEDIQ